MVNLKKGFAFLLLLVLLLLLGVVEGFAQRDKKDEKSKLEKERLEREKKDNEKKEAEKKERKENRLKNIFMKDFEPTAKTEAFNPSTLRFININKIPFYVNEAELSVLNKYQRDKDWKRLHPELLKYVCKFGINNFLDMNSMDMVWQLARLSEYLGKKDVAKDVYRLIIKHYRGDIQEAKRRYDSLSRLEKDLYVELDRYYEMVELRKHVDTLKPPMGVLVNMGEEVNSQFEDYGVTISKDDQTLIFTSQRLPEGVDKRTRKKLDENLYMSKRIGDDEDFWEPAYPFKDLNSPFNEGSPCISADGNMIIFSRCHAPDGLGDCDLYVSRKIEGKYWSKPENLGQNINSATWDSHPSLSLTEDTLFFASDRAGGFGGMDIYFSAKDEFGNWGPAQNIGPIINTRKHEVSPFMHHTYNVLYFSSDGQIVNFGDFDIYKAYWRDSAWTEPKNIGPLVNGAGREFYFAIDSKSNKIYYAKSEPGNENNLDLHSFPMPMEAQPMAIVRFSGKVTEATTGEVFEGIVSLIDLDTRIEIMPKYLRDDGSFEFELIDNKRYMLIVQGENFFRMEEIFLLKGEKEVEIATKSIRAIKFESIEFDNNSAELKPEMENDLHLIVNFLVDYPEYKLKISGHTDSSGNPAANMRLSQQRADAIAKYILDYGKLDKSRVKAKGYGSTRPIINPETTEADKKMNRRVEFRIYKGNEPTED
ncbi:OmpA family protein [Thermoflexibacter ruber]|uniref:WD40-like Beta Propeller Repeat n=1 Tax=Thermoflexibacter ruber TaxID=1003 RepID=A0A1I2GBE7_9BACT|nr:OmpA family protein [Thermoflexibacter ruber]SFF14310.1 WD40-like Beta Propeller Repeat [Thermoflexibacter ruber]